MSKIFIDRPIFAWVIAIIIMLVGIGAIGSLPVAQYPDIAPPQVNIRATYPGASAETLENSVTQILEQQLTGIDGMLYFSPIRTRAAQVSINVTFDKGTDPDIEQVQVQNAIQAAISRLPQQVQQQGVDVSKSNPDLLMIIGVYDTTDRATNVDVGDWLVNEPAGSIGAHARRRRGQRLRLAICDADLAGPGQARGLQAHAVRRRRRDAVAEHAGRGGADRRGAAAARPDAQRDRDRAIAAADAGTVPQHHRQERSERRARADQRRSARRARRRKLQRSSPGSTVIQAPASASTSRPAQTRSRPPSWSRARSRNFEEYAARLSISPTPTTRPSSSSCRSTRSSRR